MKIQCDVCEKAPATVICCADEAALCAKCDVEVHAANKLASKHQRLLLECLSNKLPPCDICQEKPAFIFCVEDRALFCQDCDEPIHSAGSLAANHQRFLATGIRVALNSNCNKDVEKSYLDPQPPPNKNNVQQMIATTKASSQHDSNFTVPSWNNTSSKDNPEKSYLEPHPPRNKNVQQIAATKASSPHDSSFTVPSWAVDDLLQFSDFESSSDKKEQLEFGELEWFRDMGLFGEQISQEALAAAEVPQLPVVLQPNIVPSYNRPTKFNMPNKKPRLEIPHDDNDEDFFTVPDLG